MTHRAGTGGIGSCDNPNATLHMEESQGGEGEEEEEEEGRLSCEREPIPVCRTHEKPKERKKRWWRKDVPPG